MPCEAWRDAVTREGPTGKEAGREAWTEPSLEPSGEPPIPRLQALGLQNHAASVSCSKPPSCGWLGQQPYDVHSGVLSQLGLRALEGASQEIRKKPLHFPSWL